MAAVRFNPSLQKDAHDVLEVEHVMVGRKPIEARGSRARAFNSTFKASEAKKRKRDPYYVKTASKASAEVYLAKALQKDWSAPFRAEMRASCKVSKLQPQEQMIHPSAEEHRHLTDRVNFLFRAQASDDGKTVTCSACTGSVLQLKPDYFKLHFAVNSAHFNAKERGVQKQKTLTAHVLYFEKQKSRLHEQASASAAAEAADVLSSPQGLAGKRADVLANRLHHVQYFAESAIPLERQDIFRKLVGLLFQDPSSPVCSSLLVHLLLRYYAALIPDVDVSASTLRQMVPMVHERLLDDIRGKIKGQRLSVAFDGTSRFAHLVGIIFRFVGPDKQPGARTQW